MQLALIKINRRILFGIMVIALLFSGLALPISRAQQVASGGLPLPVYTLAEVGGAIFAATSDGVYRSADGAAWQRLGLQGARVYALLPDPREGKRIYAATDDGVFVSSDGGGTWQRNFASPTYGLSADPAASPALVYAAADGGVYASSDGGNTWQAQGLDGHRLSALAFDASNGTLYAGDWAGLYRKVKGGTWQPVTSLVKAANAANGVSVNGIAITKSSPAVYVATSRGLYRTLDGSGGWVELGETAPCDYVAAYRDDGQILYASFNGRLKRSNDGGNGWTLVNEVSAGRIYATSNYQGKTWYAGDGGVFSGKDLYTTAPAAPITALAAGQVRDSDGLLQEAWLAVAAGNLYYSSDKGQSWQAPNNDLVGPVNAVLQSQGELVVASASGLYASDNAGANWLRADIASCTGFSSLSLNPNQLTNIYAGCAAGGVYLSKDRGQRWQALPNLGLPASAVSVAVDPTAPNTLLAMLPNYPQAPLYRSADGGQNWRSASLGLPTDLQPLSLVVMPQVAPRRLNLVAAEPAPSTLYLASADGRLFASADAGRNWGQLANAPQAKYLDLRRAPGLSVSLYLATDAGIYHSADAGSSWQQISTTAAGPLDFIGTGADTQIIVATGSSLTAVAAKFSTPTAAAAAVATSTPTAASIAAPLPNAVNFPAPDNASAIFFQETRHNLQGQFLRYWRQYDGLRIFGYPLTEEFAEDGLLVQYFERVRLEYHPNFAEQKQEPVVITLLGRQLTQGRYFIPARFFAPDPSRIYFAETQHSIQHGFYAYWQQHGGLAVFGYPISEEIKEGDYVVQWFERAKFEYRPEYVGTANEVQETQLGRQILRERGWLP